MSRNVKIIICNIVILAVCVVAIVTLAVGSFWKMDLNLTVKGSDFTGESGSEDYKAMEGVELSLPLTLDIKSSDILVSALNNNNDGLKSFIDRELDTTVNSLLNLADDLMVQISKIAVGTAFDELKNMMVEDMGEGATSAEIDEALQEKYGIKSEDVKDLQNDIGAAMEAMIKGEDGDVVGVIRDSATLTKICTALVKEQAKNNNAELTEEEIAQKTNEMKDSFVSTYDELTADIKVDGQINSATILTSVMNTMGIKNEDGSEMQFESVDDIKAYISDKIYGAVGEKENVVTKVLQFLGYFILFVMACWAYVVLKIIIKTFMKNKTVRVGLPQAFGWMPHVFFVGLPMTIIKLAPYIIKKLPEQIGDQVSDIVDKITSMVSVTISSLTWVSALCTVFLMIITIPYYRYRRQVKKGVKENKRGKDDSYEMDFSEE